MNDEKMFLHGSRSKLPLEKLSPDTDWDYAAQYEPEVERLLLKENWEPVATRDYYDANTIAVYEKGNTQISLRRDLDLYKRIWNDVDPEFYSTYLWKKSPTAWGWGKRRAWFNEKYKEYECESYCSTLKQPLL